MVKVILAFVPDQDAVALTEASAALAAQVPSVVTLGRNGVTHATVLMFDCEDPARAWEQLEPLHDVSRHFGLAAAYQSAWPPGTTFGYGTTAQGLLMVQSEAIRLLNIPPEAIHNVVGPEYFWHFTVGTTNEPVVHEVNLPNLEGTTFTCTLRLGECGPRGVFTKILF